MLKNKNSIARNKHLKSGAILSGPPNIKLYCTPTLCTRAGPRILKPGPGRAEKLSARVEGCCTLQFLLKFLSKLLQLLTELKKALLTNLVET